MARAKSVAAPAKEFQGEQLSGLRLSAFVSKLTSFQRELFDGFWAHYQQHKKWMPTRVVHSKLGTQKVRDALQPLGGDIVRELENPPNDTYELSLIGVLMTSEGEKYRHVLLQYLEFLREQFFLHPEKVDFGDKEIQEALALSDEQTALLGTLIQLGHSFGSSGWSETHWNIRVPKQIEYLTRGTPLDQPLDDWLFQHFQLRPVFAEEARLQWNQQAAQFPVASQSIAAPQPSVASIDVLKRRYQVFVSSTYDDLKDERQHVIQALLETKCIPLGMELFPAASIGQWKLIQRIIDECDYYIVIIAGRYGSLSEAQIGYTEMEFDYAASTGKPVIGFYHNNLETLPLAKSEKTEAGRDRLKRFAEKVKKRVCRPWTSAAELGSAVKSAILNELEFNPKPGWVRADAIASSEQIEKYKQRIADLEERLKKNPTQESLQPIVASSTTVPFEVSVRHYRQRRTEFLLLQIDYTTEELFSICAELFGIEGGWSEYRRKRFADLSGVRIKNVLASKFPKARFQGARISREEFEFVLHTLIAQELFMVTSDEWADNSGGYIRVTDKGLFRLSQSRVEKRRIGDKT